MDSILVNNQKMLPLLAQYYCEISDIYNKKNQTEKAIAISKKNLQSPMNVHMDGGLVQIEWDMKNNLNLNGTAKVSFEGEVNLDEYS